MIEELPNFTCGSCYLCGKTVNVSAQDETRGYWFLYKNAVKFAHKPCEEKVLNGLTETGRVDKYGA